MRKLSIRRIAIIMFIFIAAYFSLYFLSFDRGKPAYDRGSDEIAFLSSPRWKPLERLPFDITIYGRYSTFWNYLFLPAERLWLLCFR